MKQQPQPMETMVILPALQFCSGHAVLLLCEKLNFLARHQCKLGSPRGWGGHSHRPCTSTRDRDQNFGQVAKVENLSTGPKVDFRWVWPHFF